MVYLLRSSLYLIVVKKKKPGQGLLQEHIKEIISGFGPLYWLELQSLSLSLSLSTTTWIATSQRWLLIWVSHSSPSQFSFSLGQIWFSLVDKNDLSVSEMTGIAGAEQLDISVKDHSPNFLLSGTHKFTLLWLTTGVSFRQKKCVDHDDVNVRKWQPIKKVNGTLTLCWTKVQLSCRSRISPHRSSFSSLLHSWSLACSFCDLIVVLHKPLEIRFYPLQFRFKRYICVPFEDRSACCF